jgi:hypothetical protein
MKLVQDYADCREATLLRVARACHDINTSLSTVVLCIEFLAEHSDTLGSEAVKDARLAIRRISTVMATLRGTLDPEGSTPTTSGVFKKTKPPRSESERPSEPSPNS